MFVTNEGGYSGLNNNALNSFLSGSGVAVTYDTAMQDPTVKACIRVIAQTISTLPLKLYAKQSSLIGKEWQEDTTSQMAHILTHRPNPRQTTPEFIEQMIVQLAVFSEYYAIIQRSPKGKVVRLTPFNSPKQVSVQEKGEDLIYHCTTNEGKSVTLSQKDILCIRDLSLNTFQAIDKIVQAKSSIGLSISATRNAEGYYKKGSRAGGFIQTDKALSNEAFSRLQTQINDFYTGEESAHKIGLLEDGTKYVPNPYSLKDAQVLESRNAAIREIAAIFGVPVALLGIADPNMKDIETINSFFYKSCLQSIIKKIEARFLLMLPRGFYLEFDTTEYLKGDVKTQADVTDLLLTRGVISLNEARIRMNLQAIHDKELFVIGSNNLFFGEWKDLETIQAQQAKPTDKEISNEEHEPEPTSESSTGE